MYCVRQFRLEDTSYVQVYGTEDYNQYHALSVRVLFALPHVNTIYIHVHRYQNAFVNPAIKTYEEHHKEVLSRVAGTQLVIAGDGRCDSPEFSAIFCTYSLMDTATNLILHAETLKRSDVSHCKQTNTTVHYNHCLYCNRLDTNHQTWR